jgi:hypothetical protein
MKSIDIKIKIVVGVKEDGSDDVREVTVEQAIAFMKNQLDALEALRKSKNTFDGEKWRKAIEEAKKDIEKIQPFPNPWPNTDHDTPTWPPIITTTGDPNRIWCNDGTSWSNGSISYNNSKATWMN